LVLGYLLGGPVGVGTIIVTFTLGWIIQYSLKAIGIIEKYYSESLAKKALFS